MTKQKKCEACDGKFAVSMGLCAECYAEFTGKPYKVEPVKPRKAPKKPRDDYKRKYAKLRGEHKKLRLEMMKLVRKEAFYERDI